MGAVLPQGPPSRSDASPAPWGVWWKGHGGGTEPQGELLAVGSCCWSPPGLPFPAPAAPGWGIPALPPLSGIPRWVPWVPAPKELPASPPADAELGQRSQPAALTIPAASGARLQPAVARVALGTSRVVLAGGLHALPCLCWGFGSQRQAAAPLGTGRWSCAAQGPPRTWGRCWGARRRKTPTRRRRRRRGRRLCASRRKSGKPSTPAWKPSGRKSGSRSVTRWAHTSPAPTPAHGTRTGSRHSQGGGWPKAVVMGTGHSVGSTRCLPC